MSPQSKYCGGTCPPCPIWVDAPAPGPRRIAVSEYLPNQVRSEYSGNVPSKCTLKILKALRSQSPFYKDNNHASTDSMEISIASGLGELFA